MLANTASFAAASPWVLRRGESMYTVPRPDRNLLMSKRSLPGSGRSHRRMDLIPSASKEVDTESILLLRVRWSSSIRAWRGAARPRRSSSWQFFRMFAAAMMPSMLCDQK